MNLTDADIGAIILTLKISTITTILLLFFCTPLAWWLARTQSILKGPISAVVALPLVLPPTVLGFYFLIAMGPNGPIGELTSWLGLGTLPFTFWGLVVASFFYSLPFVVQPIQNAISMIDQRQLEQATILGASPVDRFFSVVVPLAKPGFITAAILGFAHTVGEFGVVLMVGGNIPEVTQVISVQIYEHVESLNYQQAHWLSATMLIFSFSVLTIVYRLNDKAVLWGSHGAPK